jgi:DNA-binding CsgD family transcriptional regulator
MTCAYPDFSPNTAYRYGCRCNRCHVAQSAVERARRAEKAQWARENRPLCACGEPMARGVARCAKCRATQETELRERIVSRRREGYLNHQIAAIEGVTPAAVASHLCRMKAAGLDVGTSPYYLRAQTG